MVYIGQPSREKVVDLLVIRSLDNKRVIICEYAISTRSRYYKRHQGQRTLAASLFCIIGLHPETQRLKQAQTDFHLFLLACNSHIDAAPASNPNTINTVNYPPLTTYIEQDRSYLNTPLSAALSFTRRHHIHNAPFFSLLLAPNPETPATKTSHAKSNSSLPHNILQSSIMCRFENIKFLICGEWVSPPQPAPYVSSSIP